MTPSALIADYQEHQQALNMAASTIEWQVFLLWRFFEFLKTEDVSALTEIDQKIMLRYQLWVAKLKNNKGEPYDPRVQNYHITTVRKFFTYLRLKNEVFVNPTAGMELARKPKRYPKVILSVEEMKTLLQQPNTKKWMGIRDRAIMEVLYSTAVRRSELLNIDVDDLRPDDKTIHIRDGKYSKDRVVPCGRTAWKWLKKYLKDVRPLRVDDPDEQALFISSRGGRLGKQGLKGIVDVHSKSAGFSKKVTPHIFRHSCATHMCDNGADIAFIQRLLGHTHADSTAIYLHIAITRLKQVHHRCHPMEQAEERARKTA